MSNSGLNQLLDMGFDEGASKKALEENGGDVQAALNKLIAIAEGGAARCADMIEESSAEVNIVSETADGTESAGDAVETEAKDQAAKEEAKSLKCDECGKLFRCINDAEFHSAKTKHVRFSESTEEVPEMSADEKNAKLEWLRKKMEEKKAIVAKEEKKNAIEMEKQRRKHGQELIQFKQRQQEKDMKDVAEERKRQKMEDRAARQRVLDQIKADKEARNKEKKGEAPPPAPAKPTMVAAPVPAKNYSECKLQIRLTNGSTLQETFKAEELLAAVRLFITLHRTDGEGPFNLMTPFPRKVFTEEDMEAPLKALGLVPSAVIVVTRAAAV